MVDERPRGRMRIRLLTYLLMLLSLSAPVADSWAVVPVLPSAALDDDDDGCLPAPQRSQPKGVVVHKKLVPARLTPQTAAFARAGTCLSPEHDLPMPFNPLPLDMLMSLQF